MSGKKTQNRNGSPSAIYALCVSINDKHQMPNTSFVMRTDVAKVAHLALHFPRLGDGGQVAAGHHHGPGAARAGRRDGDGGKKNPIK